VNFFDRAKEEAFIGFILHDDTYLHYDLCRLPNDAFYFESSRRVWKEIMRQYREGLKAGAYEQRERPYLSVMHLPTEASRDSAEIMLTWNGIIKNWFEFEEYRSAWPTTLAKQLRDLHYKRTLHALTQKGLSDATTLSAAETARDIAQGVNAILSDIARLDNITHQPSADTLWEGSQTLSTGFPTLDERTGGLPTPGMTVLAAALSMGKTSLARAIVRAQLYSNRRVFWYAKDQAPKQLLELEVANANNISISDLRKASETRRRDILDTASALTTAWESNLTITSQDLELTDLAAFIASQHQQKQFDLVVVDHMSVVTVAKYRDMYDKVTRVSNSLKSLAMDLGVAVLALAQLKKDALGSGKPELQDIKNSGDILQDADQVWMLHRPEWNESRTQGFGSRTLEEEARVFIEKNKLGPTGMARLVFIPPRAEFVDTIDRHLHA
jgi:replicative DNA helicase